MRFPGLIRCDQDGCEVLVEPHVGRCGVCRRRHGPLTNVRPGREPRRPNTSEQAGKRRTAKVKCAGLRDAECNTQVDPKRGKRCPRCHAEFKRRRAHAAAGIPSGGASRNKRRAKREAGS